MGIYLVRTLELLCFQNHSLLLKNFVFLFFGPTPVVIDIEALFSVEYVKTNSITPAFNSTNNCKSNKYHRRMNKKYWFQKRKCFHVFFFIISLW